MIWATVSSWSCFCLLYRPSASLAAKNIINLISVLTIWWCPCVVSSLVLLEEGVLWPVHSLGKTLLAFVLLHSVFLWTPFFWWGGKQVTAVGCHSLLQEIFPTQGLNLGLLHLGRCFTVWATREVFFNNSLNYIFVLVWYLKTKFSCVQ